MPELSRYPKTAANKIPTFFIDSSSRNEARRIDVLTLFSLNFALAGIDWWRADSNVDDSLRNSLPEPFDVFDHLGSVTNATIPAMFGFFAVTLLNRKTNLLPSATRELLVHGTLALALAAGFYGVSEYAMQEIRKNKPIEKQMPADLRDVAYGTISALAITGLSRRQTIKLAVAECKTAKNGPPLPDPANPEG